MTQAVMRDSRDPVGSLVLVRSLGGEPRVFAAAAVNDTHTEVKDLSGQYVIWMPRKAVYEFDESLKERLEVAYRAGDIEKLDALWKTARPWNR